METYLLAHDLGTSGNKAVLYKADGSLAASVLCEYPTYYPNSGWVEQNPQDWCSGNFQEFHVIFLCIRRRLRPGG